jgi:hypothetical protein
MPATASSLDLDLTCAWDEDRALAAQINRRVARLVDDAPVGPPEEPWPTEAFHAMWQETAKLDEVPWDAEDEAYEQALDQWLANIEQRVASLPPPSQFDEQLQLDIF